MPSINNQAYGYTYPDDLSGLTASVASQPQIPASFDVLEKSIEALVMNFSDLEKRLDPVLRHEPEATENRRAHEYTRSITN